MKFKKVQKEQFEGQICQKETEELEEKKKKRINIRHFNSVYLFSDNKKFYLYTKTKSQFNPNSRKFKDKLFIRQCSSVYYLPVIKSAAILRNNIHH